MGLKLLLANFVFAQLGPSIDEIKLDLKVRLRQKSKVWKICSKLIFKPNLISFACKPIFKSDLISFTDDNLKYVKKKLVKNNT